MCARVCVCVCVGVCVCACVSACGCGIPFAHSRTLWVATLSQDRDLVLCVAGRDLDGEGQGSRTTRGPSPWRRLLLLVPLASAPTFPLADVYRSRVASESLGAPVWKVDSQGRARGPCTPLPKESRSLPSPSHPVGAPRGRSRRRRPRGTSSIARTRIRNFERASRKVRVAAKGGSQFSSSSGREPDHRGAQLARPTGLQQGRRANPPSTNMPRA